ncbi:MAG TPA: type IV pilus biogenesis protein PilP [Scandinavium sp.]|jgi:type IV pilus biogenesis protein PilP
MRKSNLFFSLLLAITCSSMANETAISGNVTVGQLEEAQAHNLLLEQQVQTARLQQQLRQTFSRDASSDSHSQTVMIRNDATSNASLPVPSQRENISPLVSLKLLEIFGRSGELRARISLPDGGETEVHKGDALPGKRGTVLAVTSDAVQLSDGSELTF